MPKLTHCIMLALYVYAELAHVQHTHALAANDAVSPLDVLTLTHKAFHAEEVKAEPFGSIIEGLGCYDKKHHSVSFLKDATASATIFASIKSTTSHRSDL